jgi:hypothetical protein
MMRHGLIYHGGFERNFPTLKAGATSFSGTDGEQHQLPAVPAEINGVHVWYMEKAGKKFAAVRVQNDKNDVVLQHELLLDPARHMGHGNRFAPEPTMSRATSWRRWHANIAAKNPIRRALTRSAAASPSPDRARSDMTAVRRLAVVLGAAMAASAMAAQSPPRRSDGYTRC